MGVTGTTVYWAKLELQELSLHLAATDKGVCYLALPNEELTELERWVTKHIPRAELLPSKGRIESFTREIDGYLMGHGTQFSVPTDLRGTPFQVQVWQALLQIPYGHTKSYSEIAAKIGHPSAIRAVGTAIGTNPVPIIVPCHRVIGKNGTLTGYRGGLDLKARLLKIEGPETQGGTTA